MKLRNSRKVEKEFNVLFKLVKNNKTYIVYQDDLNKRLYGGKVNNKKLQALNSDELLMLNTILERIEG